MEGSFILTRGGVADEHTAVGISRDEMILLFRSGGIHACATLSQITELIRLPRFTRVPLAEPWVVGLFNHRSDPVVSFSMIRCLGLDGKDSPDGYLILTGERGHQIAFWVDEVSDIITTSTEDWQPVPDHLSLPYCTGILARHDQLYVGLRFDQLLSSLEGKRNGHRAKDAPLKLRSMMDAKAAMEYYEATIAASEESGSDSGIQPGDERPAADATVASAAAQQPSPSPRPPSKERRPSFVESVMKFQDVTPATTSEPAPVVGPATQENSQDTSQDGSQTKDDPITENSVTLTTSAPAETEIAAEATPTPEETTPPIDVAPAPSEPEAEEKKATPEKKKPVKFFVAGMDLPDAIKDASSSDATPEPAQPPSAPKKSSSLNKPMAVGGMNFPMERYADLMAKPAADVSSDPTVAEVATNKPETESGNESDNTPTQQVSAASETEIASSDADANLSANQPAPATDIWIVDAEESESSDASDDEDTGDTVVDFAPSATSESSESSEGSESSESSRNNDPQPIEIQSTEGNEENEESASPSTSEPVEYVNVPAAAGSSAGSPLTSAMGDTGNTDDSKPSITRAVLIGGILLLLLLAIFWLAFGRSASGGNSAAVPSAPSATPPQETGLTTPATSAGTSANTPGNTAPSSSIPDSAAPVEGQSATDPSGLPPSTPDTAPVDVIPPPPVRSTREPKTITLSGGPPYVHHRVVRGDSLSKIARRYLYDMMRYPELVAENNIPNPDLIYPGDIIRVPVPPDSDQDEE